MATDTINLPDEGGMQGGKCKCKGTEGIQNLCPFLPLLWLNSLGNQIHNSQLLLVCPNNVWPVGGGQNQKWPTIGPGGYMAPAAGGGSPPLQSGGQNHKWPTSGQGGYITLAA